MSDLRAPVACERCGSHQTVVDRVLVEHRPDEHGNVVPQGILYDIRCPDCKHEFPCELPPDAPVA